MDEKDIKVLKKYEKKIFSHLDKGVKPTFNNSYQQLMDAFTDASFAAGTDAMVRSLAQNGHEVFYYHFDHLGEYSLADIFTSTSMEKIALLLKKGLGFEVKSKKLGVSHADDMLYLFSAGLKLIDDPNDLEMIDLMVDLWANFATYTHPTPQREDLTFVGESLTDLKWPWLPVNDAKDPKYVILKDGRVHFHQDAKVNDRLTLWRDEFERKINYG